MKSLIEFGRQMGRWEAAAEHIQDQIHSCELGYLRYPWPLDRNCQGCRRTLAKFAERHHLDATLLDWDTIVRLMEQDLLQKTEERSARLSMGAFI